MPQDRDLYGQRPAKKKKTTELGLSNTLDFTAQLQSIIRSKSSAAGPTSLASSAKKRTTDASDSGSTPQPQPQSKAKKKKTSWIKGPARDTAAEPALSAHEREQIHRNMAAKARRYAMMQRGDYVPKEGEAAPLVDFDRKWAEKRARSGSVSGESSESSDSTDSSDTDDDDDDGELVELVDQFGRSRMVPKTVRNRELRRRARAERAAQDLAELSARPAPPSESSRIIYGDVIQTEAIETTSAGGGGKEKEDDVAPTHYRASDDVRTRGAAFYAFAADDEAKRDAQMQALADERAKTEAARAERSAQLEARKQEMAARRAALAERKAKKQADSFLDGLEKAFRGSE